MSTINEELQKCIDHVAKEILHTTGTRVLASVSGIADDIECSDELYAFCVDLIGNDATVEGYFDGKRYLDEPEEGELCLGHGIPIDAFEIYLSLHKHYGADWLSLTLRAAFANGDGSIEPEDLIKRARDSAVKAAVIETARRVTLATEIAEEGIQQLKRLALAA